MQDKVQWETQFTAEERAVGAAFEKKLREDQSAFQAFMSEIQDTFTTCDTNANGLLTRDEFKAFVTQMDTNGTSRGLKHRDTDDAFIDMVYPAFDGFNLSTEGVNKTEILMVLNLLN